MRVYALSRSRLVRGLALGLAALAVFSAAVYKLWDSRPAMAPASPIYQGKEGEKKIALTCNVDWGEEHLPRMLETFKSHNAKGTFFLSGRWAAENPELVKAIAAGGHEIGNHGYSHPHPSRISADQNRQEISRTEKAIEQITGRKTRLFAPPYGEFDRRVLEVAEELGYKTIMWSIDTIDWQKPAPAVIVQRVSQKLHDGAIILMHPTAQTAQALPQILDEAKKQGLQPVPLTELLP